MLCRLVSMLHGLLKEVLFGCTFLLPNSSGCSVWQAWAICGLCGIKWGGKSYRVSAFKHPMGCTACGKSCRYWECSCAAHISRHFVCNELGYDSQCISRLFRLSLPPMEQVWWYYHPEQTRATDSKLLTENSTGEVI